jgi:short-subunit dehydrogenase
MSKTAVITGATTGIGAAYAGRLAKDGYDLVITGRRKEIIQKLADELTKQYSIKVDVIIAELSNDSDFQKLVDVVKTKEDVEILINNAGYSGYGRHSVEIDVAEHEKMIKVHEIIPIRLISIVVPGMKKRGKGNIINVSSLGAFMALPGGSVYCATKAFLFNYSQSLYMELKDKGIKVQVLCPGPTQTDFGKNYYTKEFKDQMLKYKMMPPEKVVDYSLNCLKKNKLVCIPGLSNKVMVKLLPSLPIGTYYSVVTRMTPFK